MLIYFLNGKSISMREAMRENLTGVDMLTYADMEINKPVQFVHELPYTDEVGSVRVVMSDGGWVYAFDGSHWYKICKINEIFQHIKS